MEKGGKEEPGEEKGKGLSGHRKWVCGLALSPREWATGAGVTAAAWRMKRQLSTRLLKERAAWPSRQKVWVRR